KVSIKISIFRRKGPFLWHLEVAREKVPKRHSQHGVTKTILHLQVFGSSVEEDEFGVQLAKVSGWTGLAQCLQRVDLVEEQSASDCGAVMFFVELRDDQFEVAFGAFEAFDVLARFSD